MSKQSLVQWCLENQRMELIEQWGPNNEYTPNDITPFSKKRVWWTAPCGHTWDAPVYVRTSQKQSCPICAGKRVLLGYNDLETKRPDLAKQWIDKDIKPSEVTLGSHKIVLWRCDKGHEWKAEVKSRVQGNGCPKCSGLIVDIGVNDLVTLNPDFMKDWDYSRNELDPHKVALNSNRPAYWKCRDCGKRWKATICDRNRGTGCPRCSSEYKVSMGEKAIGYYLKKVTDIKENYHTYYLGKSEFDIFIPSLNVAIEYDGRAYHKDVSRDIIKNNLCKEHDVDLFRLREKGCPEIDGCNVIIVEKINYDNYTTSIKKLFSLLGKKYELNIPDIDVQRDIQQILTNKYVSKKERSLQELFPELLSEYDFCANGELLPTNIPAYSNQKVHWKGKCGHSWTSVVYSRTHQKQGCPYCAGKKVLVGYNDLATTDPKLASEWHPTLNGNMKPIQFTRGSNTKVHWRCSKGHEWQATINSRSNNKRGCPYCTGKLPIVGENDLAIKYPGLVEEWDRLRNEKEPSEYLPNSNKKVWWIGKCGHRWKQSIYHRVSGRGCSICAGKCVEPGVNDLLSQYPEVAEFWHPTKNHGLHPNQVTVKSEKNVWWLGSCGHEWDRKVAKQVQTNTCPYCSNHRLLVGFNDLQTRFPKIAEEWDYSINNDNPCDVLYGSNKKRCWVCKRCGNKWSSQINTRTLGNHGCPRCNHKKKCVSDSTLIQSTLFDIKS